MAFPALHRPPAPPKRTASFFLLFLPTTRGVRKMRLPVLMVLSSALGACAADKADVTDTADVRSRAPLGTHTSADPPEAVSRCIMQRVAGASIDPGSTQTVVDVQNGDTPASAAWEIRATRTGSLITVWGAKPRARGVAEAEACF
jgi:hypothetical protein